MEDEEEAKGSKSGTFMRFELRVVLILVAGVLVLGGLYGLIAGSPTKGRAAADNTNTPPAPMYVKSQSASRPTH